MIAVALLVYVATFFLQVHPFRLSWKGHRIAMNPDEGVLLVAFLAIPASYVVLGVMMGSLTAQGHANRPVLKTAFNTSVHTYSAAAAGAVFATATHQGLGAFPAAILVPIVASVVNQFSVAGLLTIITRQPAHALWRGELIASVATTSVAGITLGMLAYALFAVEPWAVVALVPVAFAFYKAMAAEYGHANELAARRALSTASARLVGEESDEAILNAVELACQEAFRLIEMRVLVVRPGARPLERQRSFGSPEGLATETITTKLLDRKGRASGEMVITIAASGAGQSQESRDLAALVAGTLSMALGAAAAARERDEQRDAAARSERLAALGILVEGVAHEINNPLFSTRGHIELARDELADEGPGALALPDRVAAATQYLNTALRGADRIERITRALGRVGRRSSGDPRPEDVRDALDRVRSRLAAHSDGLALEIEVPDDPLVVEAARGDLDELLFALAMNALDAAREAGGHVRIRAWEVEGVMSVAIDDDGPGVPAPDRAKLFTPFFTTKPDGTGLGLWAAQRIAHDLGGEVRHAPQAPRGSRFELRLPLRRSETARPFTA